MSNRNQGVKLYSLLVSVKLIQWYAVSGVSSNVQSSCKDARDAVFTLRCSGICITRSHLSFLCVHILNSAVFMFMLRSDFAQDIFFGQLSMNLALLKFWSDTKYTVPFAISYSEPSINFGHHISTLLW